MFILLKVKGDEDVGLKVRVRVQKSKVSKVDAYCFCFWSKIYRFVCPHILWKLHVL